MSPQAGFILHEQVVPRLRSAVPHAVHCVGCEDAEELVQDGTAMAARMLDSAEKAGKQVTPGNVAYYAIQHLKSGRRIKQFQGVPRRGQCSPHPIESPADIGEIGHPDETLSTQRDDLPAAAKCETRIRSKRQREVNKSLMKINFINVACPRAADSA